MAFTDGEAEAYLVFHEQGAERVRQQFPTDAEALLAEWDSDGLIVRDQFGERADRQLAADTRADLMSRAPARVERVRDLHPGRPGFRPAPRRAV